MCVRVYICDINIWPEDGRKGSFQNLIESQRYQIFIQKFRAIDETLLQNQNALSRMKKNPSNTCTLAKNL